MAEVVYNSLQYVSDEDMEAMAVYLKALPEGDAEPADPTAARDLVAPNVMETGRTVYETQCACVTVRKAWDNRRSIPPLANNRSITMVSPVNSIRTVLQRRLSAGHAQRIRGRMACRRSRTSSTTRRSRRRDLHPCRMEQHRYAGHSPLRRANCANCFRNDEECH